MTHLRLRWVVCLLTLLVGITAVSHLPHAFSATTNTLLLDWTFAGDEKGESLAYAVAAADVNGDTYTDILVGTPKDSTADGKMGTVRAFYGGQGGLPNNPDWTANSDLSGSLFGHALSSAGDVNDDGFDDIVIGAPHYKNGELESAEGRAYIYLGSGSGLSDTPTTLEINQQNAQFGYAVSGAGDVNGDDYDDVLIGARYYSNGEGSEGGAFLYLGSSSGITTTAVWSFEGNQAVAAAGASVAGAGDVNHDGYDDILIGAPYFDTPAENAGAVFVFLGSVQGPGTQPDWTLTGPHAESLFGMAVAGAGDINQDSFADILIGAPHYSNGEENEGAALLYLGQEPLMSQIPVWLVESNQLGALMGTAVAGVGDVNHDGYPDVLIGAPLYSADQAHEGRATIYLGTDSGLTVLPAWHGYGNKADTLYGQSVSTAGNVNPDDYTDIVVGAPDFRTSRDPVGQAFVYLGDELTVIEYVVYLPLVQTSD